MNAVKQLTPFMDAVVSSIREGVILSDSSGQVLYHNRAAGKLLGFDNISYIRDAWKNVDAEPPKFITHDTFESSTSTALETTAQNKQCFEQKITNNGVTRFIEFNAATLAIPGETANIGLLIIDDVTERRKLEAVFQDNLNCGLITQDPDMMDISAVVEQVAPTRAPILLQGESGTGKTLLARLIHQKSPRADKPFVEVNCAAIPESLLESELFGHVKGAFTGAINERPGRFKSADGGTLFLDEISEIPLHLQPKLLKALEEQEFQMVGSDKTVKVDIRIIAASNQNLKKMVDAGTFRADLYYRLAVIPMEVPPLRDRPGDLPLLIHHMCDQLVSRGYPDGLDCTQETMAMMLDYPWPGNVRELANAVEHAIILTKGKLVTPMCLPHNVRSYWENNSEKQIDTATLEGQRKEIQDALDGAGGNRAEAARVLGIDRSTLWRRMHRLGIA